MHDPQLATLKEMSDGTYSINAVADMHEAMAEEAEYQRRYEKAAEEKGKGRP